jgi:hypothetical protein
MVDLRVGDPVFYRDAHGIKPWLTGVCVALDKDCLIVEVDRGLTTTEERVAFDSDLIGPPF